VTFKTDGRNCDAQTAAGDKGFYLRLCSPQHVFDAATWELVFRKAEIDSARFGLLGGYFSVVRGRLVEQTALWSVTLQTLCRARE
jgi:hypothetical protein